MPSVVAGSAEYRKPDRQLHLGGDVYIVGRAGVQNGNSGLY